MPRIEHNKLELKYKLKAIPYYVTQLAGTEFQDKSEFGKLFENGKYDCLICSQNLFSSEGKFDHESGWPNFFMASGRVSEITDRRPLSEIEMHEDRLEAVCENCGSHLGYIFDDGPNEIMRNKRFCINSAALVFKPAMVRPNK